MTKQIDEIMAMAKRLPVASTGPLNDYFDAVGALRTAIEAALKECRNATLEEAAVKCKEYGALKKVDDGVPNALAYHIRSLKT